MNISAHYARLLMTALIPFAAEHTVWYFVSPVGFGVWLPPGLATVGFACLLPVVSVVDSVYVLIGLGALAGMSGGLGIVTFLTYSSATDPLADDVIWRYASVAIYVCAKMSVTAVLAMLLVEEVGRCSARSSWYLAIACFINWGIALGMNGSIRKLWDYIRYPDIPALWKVVCIWDGVMLAGLLVCVVFVLALSRFVGDAHL